MLLVGVLWVSPCAQTRALIVSLGTSCRHRVRQIGSHAPPVDQQPGTASRTSQRFRCTRLVGRNLDRLPASVAIELVDLRSAHAAFLASGTRNRTKRAHCTMRESAP